MKMIVGNLYAQEDISFYPEAIKKALDYIKTHDLLNHELGRFPLDGDNVILQVMETTTQPREERRAEIHKNYIDLQFMVKGKSKFGYYPTLQKLEVDEDLLEEKDNLFFKYNKDIRESIIECLDGTYIVMFPGEVHIPSIMVDGPETIKKVVMKIKMTEVSK